jgi:pimeloyl-ACP methyl ester carboxylesterase
MNTSFETTALADDALVASLPGFTNGYASIGDIRLHYVHGGAGEPLVLLPGWPQTWWAYHKILPLLADKYHVIAVDIRGMGSSSKPATGYEKKNMAADIFALVTQLGLKKVHIAGHDIGAHVAYSYAANYPDATGKLIMLDTPHPDEGMYQLPMLPVKGNTAHVYPWWLAFNQVKALPEQLLQGRVRYLHDHIFEQVLLDDTAITAFDRAVYAQAYDSPEGIRAGNAWYQAFPDDIAHMKHYSRLLVPVAGIGGSGFDLLQYALPQQANELSLYHIPGCGHFIMEEKPAEITRLIKEFIG